MAKNGIDLFHFHHRLEGALRGRTIRIGPCYQQYIATIEAARRGPARA